jgi:GGDEF domain-containing protein
MHPDADRITPTGRSGRECATRHARATSAWARRPARRTVTESRIEAARHANPLTFLPGNIPITEHIERLLASGGDFVACYADLNNFKPFRQLGLPGQS